MGLGLVDGGREGFEQKLLTTLFRVERAGNLSKTEPGRRRQLKRTHDMSFSKTKEDSSGPQLSETRTREAMR